jgi:hypothetical protein
MKVVSCAPSSATNTAISSAGSVLPEQKAKTGRVRVIALIKLSRTYATLVEALNRHRGKGQQKVTVEHVHVHEGGQAIVGKRGEARAGPPPLQSTVLRPRLIPRS